MRIKALAAAGVAAICLGAGPASAGVVTYTLSGRLDGAIGGATLADTPFTWTLKANNLAQQTTAGFPALQALSANIQLGGIGDAVFSQPTFVFRNDNQFAFTDQAVTSGAGWTSPAFLNDALGAAFAPQSATFSAGIGQLATSLGAFSLTQATDLSFSATVTPTPPVLYTLTGDLSGTLNGVAFNSDPFSWTLLADTTGLGSYFGLPALTGLGGSIRLGGFSAVTATGGLEVAESPDIAAAGFVNPTGTQGISFNAPLFAGYALGDALAGAPVEFGTSLPVQTSGGELDISGATNLRLSAAPVTGVPEAATWALMLIGFGGLGSVMRGRRTASLA